MSHQPDPEVFTELSERFSVVPVWREIASDMETPVSAFRKVTSGATGFLLESVEGGERWARYSFIGIDPFLVMVSDDGNITWEGETPVGIEGSDPLKVFRAALESYSAPHIPGLPPFHSGAVGYMGYDVVRYLEQLPISRPNHLGAPEMIMIFPRTMIAFDHLKQRITVVSNVVGGGTRAEAERRVDDVVKLLEQPLAYSAFEPPQVDVTLPNSTMTQAEFESAVLKAKEHIQAGDIFQVVLSHRFSMELSADPFDVYRVLRLVNPSPYMFFIRHPRITVFGSSPEPLIKVQGDHVIQRPIAGTRPRGSTGAEDAAIEEEFLKDEKERAEHVMLVDLARNDVGRVADYGSVSVDELMAVERYSHVMHLVSQVSGTLAAGCDALDALYAAFPAGTVSGAPKIRAMEIINELEPTRRGPYAGVVGYFDFGGNLDSCIILRTAYALDGWLHVQAGAGIVADSDPSKEWWETVNKAKAILTAAAMA